MLLGSPSGGVMRDKLPDDYDWLMVVLLLQFGCAMIAVPFCKSIGTLALSYGMIGFGVTCANTMSLAYLVALWRHSSGTMLNLCLGFNACGKLLSPQVFAPFLSKIPDSGTAYTAFKPLPSLIEQRTIWPPIAPPDGSNMNKSILFSDKNLTYNVSETEKAVFSNTFYIPYLVIAGCVFGCAVSYVVTFLSVKPKGVKLSELEAMEREIAQPDTEETDLKDFDRSLYAELCLCLSVFVMYYNIAIAWETTSDYIFTVGVESPLRLNTAHAANISTAYNLSAALGVFFAAWILKFISTNILFYVYLITAISMAFLMSVFLSTSVLAIWTTSLLFAFADAPIYSTGVAFINQYTRITGCVAAVLEVGLSIGVFVAVYTGSLLLETFGSTGLFIQVALALVVCAVASRGVAYSRL